MRPELAGNRRIRRRQDLSRRELRWRLSSGESRSGLPDGQQENSVIERQADGNSSSRAGVVLGSHRSATSLLASVVRALGVQLGGELVPADRHNPAGYIEHGDIVRIHRQLIDQLDRRWSGPKRILLNPVGQVTA